MPAGCVVSDRIRKKNYITTTVDTLPNDVEAVKQALEKMLEQAEEQKTAVEQK
jgi:outer membrane murein-binding lipoprotein Lpp